MGAKKEGGNSDEDWEKLSGLASEGRASLQYSGRPTKKKTSLGGGVRRVEDCHVPTTEKKAGGGGRGAFPNGTL